MNNKGVAMIKRYLVLVFCAAILMPWSAEAKLYKHVDAAGNVSYSDKPPEKNDKSAGGSTEEMDVSDAHDFALPPGALRDKSTAAAVVLGFSSGLRFLADYCGRRVPSSASGVDYAYSHWQDDNAALLKASSRILRAHTVSSDIADMERQVDALLRNLARRLDSVPQDKRKDMCENLPRVIASHKMSLSDNKHLVRLVMSGD